MSLIMKNDLFLSNYFSVRKKHTISPDKKTRKNHDGVVTNSIIKETQQSSYL